METISINNVLLNKDTVENFSNRFDSNSKYNPTYEDDFFITEDIKFNDDKWVFTRYDSLDRSAKDYTFDFCKIKYSYKYHLKNLILERLIINREAVTTSRSFYIKLRKFIVFLINNNVTNPILIDLNLVKKFFESIKNTQEANQSIYKLYITELLQEIECKENISYSKIFNFLEKRNPLLLKAEKENGKTNIIPRNVFNNIVSVALKDIKDDDLDIFYKKIACMMVILGETGMRIGELTRLEVNRLKTITVVDDTTLNYLEFKTYKTTDCTDFRWTECFANDKVVLAYKTLNNLTNATRTDKYIYPSETTGGKLSENGFKNHMTKFFARHQNNLGFENLDKDELNLVKTKIITENIQQILGCELSNLLSGRGFMYYVSAHQFRVTVCTQLYNEGVSLEWIRIHMNHLDEDMTIHYIRQKKFDERDRLIAETLKSRMDEDGELLETDTSKISDENIIMELSNPELKQYYDDINKFLEKNKFKIKKDLNEIISALTKTSTPLMEMEYGYCAQHALSRVCARQEYISSLDDYYHIKPQLPNLIYLELTYKRFKEKDKIVNHNKKIAKKDNKYTLEYERENKALKSFVTNRLVPELNLAKEEIAHIGLKDFLAKYPSLSNITNKIDTILEKEVLAWI